MSFPSNAFAGMLETCSLLRVTGSGTFSKGKYTAPTKATISIRAVVQPIDFGSMLKIDPQADIEAKHYKVRTATIVRVDDQIVIRGEVCKVTSMRDWQTHGAHHLLFCSTTRSAVETNTVMNIFDDSFDETFQ